MTRDQVFEILRKQKIDLVEVHFSGGNDEGGIDNIYLFYEDELMEELSPYDNNEKPYTEDFVDTLCDPVYKAYYSFAGDFDVNGLVVWNVKTENVTMKKTERVPHEDYSEGEV